MTYEVNDETPLQKERQLFLEKRQQFLRELPIAYRGDYTEVTDAVFEYVRTTCRERGRNSILRAEELATKLDGLHVNNSGAALKTLSTDGYGLLVCHWLYNGEDLPREVARKAYFGEEAIDPATGKLISTEEIDPILRPSKLLIDLLDL